MHRIRRRQLRYGVPAGVATLGALWLAAAVVAPRGVLSEAPSWQATLRVVLDLHFVGVDERTVLGYTTTAVISPEADDALHLLRAATPVVIAVASATTAAWLSRSGRLRDILENVGVFLLGYGGAFVVATVAAGAVTDTGVVMLSAAALAAAFAGLSIRLQRMDVDIPYFGIVTITVIVYTGLFVLAFGLTIVLRYGVPLVLMGTSAAVGALGLYAVRTWLVPADSPEHAA